LLIGALALFVCNKDPWRRKRAQLLVVPLVLWVPYVVLVGGDFMPAHRFLLPCLAVLILLSMEVTDAAVALEGPSRPRLLVAIAALLAFFAATQLSDSFNLDAVGFDRQLVRSGEAIGRLLARSAHGRQPLVAVDAAGAVPYFSSLPALDMLGLNDRFIAHHPPPNRGHSLPGHDLGSGAYVLGRAPDLILFQGFRTATELLAREDFRQQYQRITIGEGSIQAEAWIRKEGRIGIERTQRRIVLPGVLFATGGCLARGDGGRLVTAMPEKTIASLSGVSVPPGRWKAIAVASPAVRVSVAAAAPSSLDVTIESGAETLLSEVVLEPESAQ
jgi:hypothetical protein